VSISRSIEHPGRSLWAPAIQALLLTFGVITACQGQTYPRWFLEQGRLLPASHVGYAQVGYYRDSVVGYALRNACENAARSASSQITGKREHWATEIGTFVMDDDVSETFDTSAAARTTCGLIVADSMLLNSMMIVLAVPGEVMVPATARTPIRIAAAQPPSWIQALPEEAGFIYSSGLSAEYFYEKSSWLRAEQMARKNLAFSVYTQLKSLQRVAEQGVEKSREEVSVGLRDIEVVARWRDVKNRIMHVLVRMPRI
jgi:hypothetical protein